MADQFEDFRIFLPKYLAAGAQQSLFSELSQFPKNINQRLYTDRLRGERTIFQGDGLRELPVTNLPDTRIQNARRVMVLSNSCDVNFANQRLIGPRLLYCPIVAFSKYCEVIEGRGGSGSAKHFDDVKMQRVSSLFYLPAYGHLEESIALLDRIVNYDLSAINIDDVATSRV